MHIPNILSELMPTPQPLSLSIVGILLVIVLLARRRNWLNRLRGCVLPPGPRGLPVIGNWLDLPRTDQPWIVYDDWAQTYGALYHHVIFFRDTNTSYLLLGDIVYAQVMGTPMLVVSSPDIAFDLLDKRSAIYSDRSVSVMNELYALETFLTFIPTAESVDIISVPPGILTLASCNMVNGGAISERKFTSTLTLR